MASILVHNDVMSISAYRSVFLSGVAPDPLNPENLKSILMSTDIIRENRLQLFHG